MRIVTPLPTRGHFKVDYIGMSKSEKLIVEDVKDQATAIIDSFVYDMVENKQFKEQTQEVADFIESIVGVINDIELESNSDSEEKIALMVNALDRWNAQWQLRVENHIYVAKAKAAGINVSKADVEAWIAAEDEC